MSAAILRLPSSTTEAANRGGLPLGGSGGVEGDRREPVTSRWGDGV